MEKILVFDMDGTIADLYGVPEWLQYLRNEDLRPYQVAAPLYDMDTLNAVLHLLKNIGWKIIVTSWTAKNGSEEYNKKVEEVKKKWLKKYNFPCDKIHVVKYGVDKNLCTANEGGFQILIDDNEEIRKSWTLGDTIDAGKKDIIKELADLLFQELENF